MFIHYNLSYITDLPHPYNKIGDGPEGPEARTSADKLRLVIKNKTINSWTYDARAKIIGADNLHCPAKIIDVKALGKKILLYLDNNYLIITSLGMTGRWQYKMGNHSHTKLEIVDIEKRGIMNIATPVCDLYFDDTRYFGEIAIIPMQNYALYVKDIGIDLLDRALNDSTWISLVDWLKIFQQEKFNKKAICELLLKQELVAGIGNYLKSEILYYSCIHPNRLAETLSVEDWDRIRKNAHMIIRLSYAYGGFTIESFLSPDGVKGMYPPAVYGRVFDDLNNPVITLTTKDTRTSHIALNVQK